MHTSAATVSVPCRPQPATPSRPPTGRALPPLASWRLALWLSGSNDVELLTALLQIQSQTLRLYATAAFQWRALRDGDEVAQRWPTDPWQSLGHWT